MEVALDCATWCCTSATPKSSLIEDVLLDVRRIRRRFEHEGMSFLTISLPAFGKEFERALDLGAVSDDLFPRQKRKKGTKLPELMGGFLRLVFDPTSGRLVDVPSTSAIQAVRQLAGLFGKILLECSDERKSNALGAYIDCEYHVRQHHGALVNILSDDEYVRVAGLCFADVFSAVDRKIYNYELIPKHGPGATADKLLGNEKWNQRIWHERLETVFPSTDFLIASPRFFSDLARVDMVEPGKEQPVKVILVPKTLKTPRVIAVEPTCMQYAQQAVAAALVQEIEHSYVSDMIGFVDQEPNRYLAQHGSLSGELATLDLSEASDRVSNLLVEALFSRHPQLSEAVQSCRSTKADVPGHGIIPLTKFASMGSALCFPIEAMVFLTVALVGIQNQLNRPLSVRDIKLLRGSVRVYGDDIIVPVEFVLSVVEALESYGFKVNSSKSFWTGKFRESCGKEYYNGDDVSFVKLRRMLPTRLTDTQEIISAVSFRNLMYQQGFWNTARWMDELLGDVLRGYYPMVHTSSPLLGRHSALAGEQPTTHLCKYTHRSLKRGYVVRAPLPINELDGSAALLKWFTKMGEEPFAQDHLERSGRPRVVNIKLVMAPTY